MQDVNEIYTELTKEQRAEVRTERLRLEQIEISKGKTLLSSDRNNILHQAISNCGYAVLLTGCCIGF